MGDRLLQNSADVAFIVVPLVGGIMFIVRYLARRLGAQDRALEEIRQTQALQFGGNSGGLREKVDKIADKVDKMSVDVAQLQGREAQRRDDLGRFTTRPS